MVLLEPDVRERHLAHRVRATAGDGCASEATALGDELVATMSAAMRGDGVVLAHAHAPELGAPFADAGFRAYALAVEPPLTQTFEGALIVTPPTEISAAALSELTLALSEDRANELAHAAFAAIQSAVDPMELTDGQVCVTHVNPAFERATGYARHELVGRTLRFLRPEGAEDETSVRFGEGVAERGGTWFGVVTTQARDRGLHPHEVMLTRYRAPGGRFSGNFAVRRALAHRSDREAALTDAHQQFRAVLSALPEPLAVLVGPQVYFGNDAFFELLGRASAQIVASRFDAFLHPEDAKRFEARAEREVVTVRLVRPDGSVRSAELGAAGAISFEGLDAEIVFVRDTTERRITSEREAHASRLSALGALAASIAHEINNPLSFVLGNLEAIRDSEGPTLDRGAVTDAIGGAARIQKIVGELSTFAQLDAGSRELEAIDVESVVRTALAIVANQIRHTTKVEVVHATCLCVRAEEGPLVQVLVNLFVNASQAMATLEGSDNLLRVTTCSASSGEVELVVRDTGSGMPPEVLARIFEPFFTTRPEAGGRGLGLSVTRDIMQRFGGTIVAASTVGVGTTFTLCLPRAEPLPAATTSTPAEQTVPPKTLLVVVVDDEEAVGRVVRRVLHAALVEAFSDPVEAVARLVEGPAPDVILCDAMMPSLTGPEVFARVVAARPELAERFLFMTGGTFTGPTASFLDARAGRVLGKPFTARELREAVLAAAPPSSPPPSSPGI